MNPYADADQAHEEKISRDEAIEAIFEEMMDDRELVRQAIVDVRNRHMSAKSGGEFSGLVRNYVWNMAASAYSLSRINRNYRNGEW